MLNHLRLEVRGGLFLAAALVVAFLFIGIPFAQAAPGDVVINEFSSASSPEWVELRNTTASPIDLTGWKLTELTSPQGTPAEVNLLSLSGTLPAGGVLTFDVSGLNDPGDSIGLYDNSGTPVLIDRVIYGTVAGGSYPTTTGLGTEPSVSESAFRDSLGGWHIVGFNTKNSANVEIKNGSTYYQTIQAAITAATSGDTINVGAGTYIEQVLINKNLALNGAGTSTTNLQAPVFMSNDFLGQKVVLETASSSSVTVSGLTISGPGSSGCNSINYGIFIIDNSTLNISNSAITNIKDTPFSGCQNGVAIRAGSNFLGQVGHAVISNVTISGYQKGGIVIDGTGSTGNISNNTIAGAGPTPTIAQNGIQISRSATGTITGNIVTGNYWTGTYGGSNNPVSDSNADGSAGILLYQSGSGVQVSNNNLSSNQFSIWSVEATGTLTIGGNNIVGGSDTGSAKVTGIAVWNSQYGDAPVATNATVGNNVVSNVYYGLLNQNNSGSLPPITTAHLNSFSDIRNLFVFNNATTTASLIATNNWWGTASSTVIASKISGPVTFDPWYINPGRTVLNTAVSGSTVAATAGTLDFAETTDGAVALPDGVSTLAMGNDSVLSFASSTNAVSGGSVTVGGSSVSLNGGLVSGVDLNTAPTVGGTTVTVEKAVTLSSGTSSPIVITNAAVSNASVSIPDATTILAPSGWDGTIQPPKSGSSSGTAPSGFSVGDTVIEVGSPTAVLLFNKAVTIVLSGITGAVGYKPAGSNDWIQITATCSGDYANPASPAFPGECAISNGTDTKIVTFHFTTFGSLVVPAPTPSTGGAGGGGGIVGSNFGPVFRFDTSAPQVAQATAAAPAQGQVLGAATFRFEAALALGSVGDDVTELQNRLKAEGVYAGPVTGYFGSLTAEAVKLFQAKYGIPQVGVVGPQTRNKLNVASATTVPGCEGGNKFNTQTGMPCASGAAFGAAVSTFTRSLQVGSRGDDVTALQNRLTAEGVYKGPITGYFGPLTAQAVREFQAKYGIESVGVVGPRTRAELNKAQ